MNGDENSIKANFNYSDNTCSFSTSDEINTGVDLENLPIDTYYMFIKVTYSNSDIKYYSLVNDSEYSDITYYTITKKIIVITKLIFHLIHIIIQNIYQ